MKGPGSPRLLSAVTFFRRELVSLCASNIVRRATRSFTAAVKAGAESVNKYCRSASCSAAPRRRRWMCCSQLSASATKRGFASEDVKSQHHGLFRKPVERASQRALSFL